ncbi:unnamed protein product [Owenia fusiformis]|uniref:Uncharacterized protein n=1 Tax=Owenia fusiformis TaxID=6347 RepID=A0A8J1TMQ8_OWEFU|nr:unnamed protein product [Owenia fusiformis]
MSSPDHQQQQQQIIQNSNDPQSTTVTIRMIMQGKEVGSIIGKKGDNVKKYREESGAKINISDGSCPERIVTVTGSTDSIFKAFTMICKKFEEDLQNLPNGVPRPPVTLRLIVPASQCGSLIGKGGSKIKEIREITGASIQVASEMLPNSTERAVTISGTADAITQCIYHICLVMLESPPKGATIPYRPKPVMPPVIFAGGQAFTVPGQFPAMPQPQDPNGQLGGMNGEELMQGPQGMLNTNMLLQIQKQMAMQQSLSAMPHLMPGLSAAQPGLIQSYSPYVSAMGMTPVTPAYTQQPAPQVLRPGNPAPQQQQAAQQQTTPTPIPTPNAQTHEITVPNDLIGCIIGRGGQKINEIRQFSGAQIKISNPEDGSTDRKVTITGVPEAIQAAQYLINASMELHKTLTLDPTSSPQTAPLVSQAPSLNTMGLPLSHVPVKPLPMSIYGLNVGLVDNATKTYMQKIKATPATATALKNQASVKFAPY